MKNIYVSPDELKSLIKFDLLSVECFVKSDSDGIVKVKCLDTGDEFVNYFHDEIGVNLNIFLKDFHLFLQKINKTRGAIIQKEYFQEKLSTLFM